MITSYEDYLTAPKALAFEEMRKLHLEMIGEIGDDPEALEICHELVRTATRYAGFRAEWPLLEVSQKLEKDASRSLCHNSLITKFNMLARYLKMQGKEAKWRDVLGYEEDDKYYRKRIGDFGCYMAFVNSVNAR